MDDTDQDIAESLIQDLDEIGIDRSRFPEIFLIGWELTQTATDNEFDLDAWEPEEEGEH